MREADDVLAAEIGAYCGRLRRRYGDAKSAEVPGPPTRGRSYKALGLDPTKTRPSNEALLRRVLKGEPLYRINTLVDALNLCSLRQQLPFGLYDLDHIEPPVSCAAARRGRGTRESARRTSTSRAGPCFATRRAPSATPPPTRRAP